MAFEDKTVSDLKTIAEEHGVDLTGASTKPEIISALVDAGVSETSTYEVSGVQPGQVTPNIPITRADFAALLLDPETPSQNQSAPPADLLNPHLFPQR